ncbi:MAG: hypothetical protein KGI51_08930 [Rhodospirillales bacterium]|nr:hypothetical protein [Rhodospirillales bacterium]
MNERRQARAGSILRGAFLLARGRAEGFAEFVATPQGFLASLAPMLAVPVAIYLLVLLARFAPHPAGAPAPIGPAEATADLLSGIVAVLAPPVLSFALARRWGREALWLRYATANNWTQLAVTMTLLLGLAAAAPLLAALGQSRLLLGLLLLALAGYALWLPWFLARRGLSLSVGRAIGLVLLVHLGTILLAIGPRLAMLATHPPA